jgi:hypothetical protein
MDLTQSIEARSDQINADDLLGGPQTYTIREVIAGKAESPFDFLLVETERAYRPSKTMRRVIVAAWGPEASNYAGRRLTVYREPTIQFGGKTVGGIRISAMSHIDKRLEVMAQVTRGKREKFTVDPLPSVAPTPAQTPPEPTAEEVAACTDKAELGVMWKRSGPERRAQIEQRVADLNNEPEQADA